MYHHELKATVPRRILECSAVSREINFTSQEEIRQFRLEQRVFLAGACIEDRFLVFLSRMMSSMLALSQTFRKGVPSWSCCYISSGPDHEGGAIFTRHIFLPLVPPAEWFFDFGFVIPGSTNSWQQTIESAGEDRMLAAEDLSGRMTIETTFLDGRTMLFKTLVRIFYE
ncbi:unnamed protein product [Ectocarpus fasciculatus]